MLNQTPIQAFLHAQPAREYTLPPITPDSSFEDLLARQNYLQASGIMDRLDAETAESCTRLLIHDGPHVIKGAAKGAVKAFNPVNLAHGACVMAKQTSAAAGFILLQAARLETAQELAATQPEQAQVILEQYNAANAAVVEGAIQIGHEFAAHMSTMSREERIEFIAETLAEVALTKSSTKFWLAATGKALNAAGKGVRKIAQVVEEVNPAKPKAIAATPEGIMLDAAEVLETEANPIAEVAKLQEGAAVEGKAATQGMQAAEDAPKVTEPSQVHEVPAAEGMQEHNPLDRRNMTPEQLEAEAARKAQGKAIRDRGKVFENQLQERFGGHGSFKVDGREFDGAFENIWYEAKSGRYWDVLTSSPAKLESFKSAMGQRLNIAKQHGAQLKLFSNSPIPEFIKDWLTKKGIEFLEIL
jgi:hypothetical protein